MTKKKTIPPTKPPVRVTSAVPKNGTADTTAAPEEKAAEATTAPEEKAAEATAAPEEKAAETTETPEEKAAETTETPEEKAAETTETPEGKAGETTDTPEALGEAEKETDPMKERAKEVFASHNIDEVYFTSDGNAFTKHMYASMHATTLPKGLEEEVITVKRSEV